MKTKQSLPQFSSLDPIDTFFLPREGDSGGAGARLDTMRLLLELHRADRIASGGVLPFFFDKYTLHLDVKHFLAGGLLFEQESPCW